MEHVALGIKTMYKAACLCGHIEEGRLERLVRYRMNTHVSMAEREGKAPALVEARLAGKGEVT
jgi:hypothetical protein